MQKLAFQGYTPGSERQRCTPLAGVTPQPHTGCISIPHGDEPSSWMPGSQGTVRW